MLGGAGRCWAGQSNTNASGNGNPYFSDSRTVCEYRNARCAARPNTC